MSFAYILLSNHCGECSIVSVLPGIEHTELYAGKCFCVADKDVNLLFADIIENLCSSIGTAVALKFFMALLVSFILQIRSSHYWNWKSTELIYVDVV